MKEFNGIVRVGETADIEKAVEMPFSEVLKLPSFKGEGRGRKPIYNFICFDSERNRKNKYYKKLFIKECMESWKIRFPLSRYIFINVEDCFELSLWTKLTIKAITYPTDSIRIYFVSVLDNCFYLDTDVYISKEAKLPLNENEFIINATGTLAWNKKRNNKKYQEWFDLYENEAKRLPARNISYKTLIGKSDLDMYLKYMQEKIKCYFVYGNEEHYVMHCASVINTCGFNNARYLKFSRKNENYYKLAVIPGECFWALLIYCVSRNDINRGNPIYEYISLITNNNRFYVKLENGIVTGISFTKKDGYNISYSNRLFWDWVKHYINNGMYKNIKLEDVEIAEDEKRCQDNFI